MSVDSEKTPDSSQKALEDIRPEHGALARPVGPPTTLGPAINPFWSESAREEAILRACRPAHLPSSADDPPPQVYQQAMTSVSPQRDIPDAVKAMVQSLVQENSRLYFYFYFYYFLYYECCDYYDYDECLSYCSYNVYLKYHCFCGC